MHAAAGTRAELVCGMLVRDGAVLLVHRSPDRAVYPGVWDFPGGHVEAGETRAAALVRELGEELDVVVDPPAGEADLVLTTEDYRLAVWVITRWTGEPRNAQPDEHDDLAWFAAPEALAVDFADPEYRDLIRTTLAQPRIEGCS